MRIRGILWLAVLGFIVPDLMEAQVAGQRFSLQLNAGLGITNGRNLKEDLRQTNQNPEMFTPSAGASMRFGLSARIRMVQHLYIEPELLFSFYGQEATAEDLQVQLDDGTVTPVDLKLNWSNTDIGFGIGPVYYFRIKNFPVHPFAGMAVRIRFFRSGDVKTAVQFKDPQLRQFSRTFTIKASEAWIVKNNEDRSSITTMAMAFKAGMEFVLAGGMTIPLTISYELNMSSFVSNVFRVETGFAFYF